MFKLLKHIMTNEEIFLEIKDRAESGEPQCMTDLGQFYLYGIGTGVDTKEGLLWAKKAAEAGDLMGLHNMGVLYQEGVFLEQDIEKAIEYYKKASDKHFGRSTNNLGICAYKGIGMPQNFIIAKDYFEKAIEQEEWKAYENLAFLYLDGNGKQQDYIKSADFFHKAEEKNVLTKEGNKAFTQLLFKLYCYGVSYAEGFNEVNFEKARQYIRISSLYNYLPATKYLLLHFYIPDMCLTGMERHNITRPFLLPQIDYIEKSIIMLRTYDSFAIHEIEKGIDTDDSYDLCYAALLTLFGVCNFGNHSHIELLDKSIEQGCIPAVFWLGYCYEMGKGVEKSLQKAAECYSKVIQVGHTNSLWNKDFLQLDDDRELAESYYRLALICYNSGKYPPEKIKSMLAPKYGNSDFHSQSLMLIVQCLLDEKRDLHDSEIMNILCECAKHKNDKALFLLGEYYSKHDDERAQNYLLSAIELGSINAVRYYVELAKKGKNMF